MSDAHHYGLFVMTKGRWHSFRAVCHPKCMKMSLRANHEVPHDEVEKWRLWVVEDYEEQTGSEITEE